MDITPIFEAVITLFAAVVMYVLVPYIRNKTTTEQQKKINLFVKVAVEAAEQIYVGTGRGSEKKKYVVNFLNDRGIVIDEAVLDAMIESAVYNLKNGVISVN